MRLVLNSHPLIHCYDEWKSYSILSGESQGIIDKPWTGYKIPTWTDLLVDSLKYRAYYCDDPIIFMLRDVRGCIASMMTLPTGRGPFVIRVQEAIDAISVNFDRVLAKEMEGWKDHIDVRKAALFWKYKTQVS